VMNDLEAAIARADEANLAALPAILDWLQAPCAAGQLWKPGRAGRLAQSCACARRQQSLKQERGFTSCTASAARCGPAAGAQKQSTEGDRQGDVTPRRGHGPPLRARYHPISTECRRHRRAVI
jgi:hypothetical protein